MNFQLRSSRIEEKFKDFDGDQAFGSNVFLHVNFWSKKRSFEIDFESLEMDRWNGYLGWFSFLECGHMSFPGGKVEIFP